MSLNLPEEGGFFVSLVYRTGCLILVLPGIPNDGDHRRNIHHLEKTTAMEFVNNFRRIFS